MANLLDELDVKYSLSQGTSVGHDQRNLTYNITSQMSLSSIARGPRISAQE